MNIREKKIMNGTKLLEIFFSIGKNSNSSEVHWRYMKGRKELFHLKRMCMQRINNSTFDNYCRSFLMFNSTYGQQSVSRPITYTIHKQFLFFLFGSVALKWPFSTMYNSVLLWEIFYLKIVRIKYAKKKKKMVFVMKIRNNGKMHFNSGAYISKYCIVFKIELFIQRLLYSLDREKSSKRSVSHVRAFTNDQSLLVVVGTSKAWNYLNVVRFSET